MSEKKLIIEKIENLLNKYFRQYPWYDEAKNPYKVVEQSSRIFNWGGLIKVTSSKFLKRRKEEDRLIGIKPMVIDIVKNKIVLLNEWPLKGEEESLIEHIKENKYSDIELP